MSVEANPRNPLETAHRRIAEIRRRASAVARSSQLEMAAHKRPLHDEGLQKVRNRVGDERRQAERGVLVCRNSFASLGFGKTQPLGEKPGDAQLSGQSQ